MYTFIRLSLKRGFNGCGHGLGRCDGLGGFYGFDGFSGCDRLGGFDALDGFSGFDRLDGFGRFESRLP